MSTGTTSTTRTYAEVLGVSDAERARLLAQAAALAPEASALLDAIGVAPGWRALDVGCGPIGILDLLAERVGPGGEVIGIDNAEQFVDLATAIARERGLANVRVVLADALQTGLQAGSFDLVHERLLLIGAHRDAVATEMVALARPGGVVAAQDIDAAASFCEPAHPSCVRLLEVFRAFTGHAGADLSVGRRLGAVLRKAGVEEVQVAVRAQLEPPGSPRRQQLAALAGSAREGIVRSGLMSGDECDRLIADSAAHHADPATIVFGGLLFQAWGRRPVA